jgi:hypothetical protein
VGESRPHALTLHLPRPRESRTLERIKHRLAKKASKKRPRANLLRLRLHCGWRGWQCACGVFVYGTVTIDPFRGGVCRRAHRRRLRALRAAVCFHPGCRLPLHCSFQSAPPNRGVRFFPFGQSDCEGTLALLPPRRVCALDRAASWTQSRGTRLALSDPVCLQAWSASGTSVLPNGCAR